MIGHLHGHHPEYEFQDWRPGNQRYYASDTRKFRNATGWSAKVRPHAGTKKLYRWLRESQPKTYVKQPPGSSVALDPSVLYTYSFLINELSEAFKLLERRPEGFLKAWIRTAA
jgi:hypothetical protein